MSTRYDPTSAEVLIYVFREGFLSPVGHDLRLRATGFEIDVEDSPPRVSARFDAASVRVDRAMRGGRDAGPVAPRDRLDIERNVRDVLRPDSFPEIRFESTSVENGEIAGRLELRGAAREVRFPWREEDGRRVAEARVDQRLFGIAPFRAFFGTLRVAPVVVVRVALGPPRA